MKIGIYAVVFWTAILVPSYIVGHHFGWAWGIATACALWVLAPQVEVNR